MKKIALTLVLSLVMASDTGNKLPLQSSQGVNQQLSHIQVMSLSEILKESAKPPIVFNTNQIDDPNKITCVLGGKLLYNNAQQSYTLDSRQQHSTIAQIPLNEILKDQTPFIFTASEMDPGVIAALLSSKSLQEYEAKYGNAGLKGASRGDENSNLTTPPSSPRSNRSKPYPQTSPKRKKKQKLLFSFFKKKE